MVDCKKTDVPPVGSIITVKYAGTHLNGRLKSPLFWRVREDVSWETLSITTDQKKVNTISFDTCQHFDNALWTKKENHRFFFDYLGKECRFTQMDDWYKLRREVIEEYGGSR